jgi:hypothetical protein
MSGRQRVVFIPETPGGTVCIWLESATEAEAWAKLLEDAKHMPYKTRENFEARGYKVKRWMRGPQGLTWID